MNTIVADRETSNRVYATTINTTTGGGFFFVSNDGGASWQPSMRNMPPRLIGYSILQDERDGNVIYLGTNLGLYRSADRGASWAPVTARKTTSPKKKTAAKTARKPTPQRRGSTAARATAPPPSAPRRENRDSAEELRRDDTAGAGSAGPRRVSNWQRRRTDGTKDFGGH